MIQISEYINKTNAQILYGLDMACVKAEYKMKAIDQKNFVTYSYYVRLKDGSYRCVTFPWPGATVISAIAYTATGMVAEATVKEYPELIKKTNAPINVLKDLAGLELAKLVLKEDIESLISFNAMPAVCEY